jgi:phage tail sheath protein FI
MSVTTSYPGVYVQEIPSGVRTITGVATSITAFVGRTRWGPENEPRIINGFADYERVFGGLWADSTVSFAVRELLPQRGQPGCRRAADEGASAATIDVGDLHLEAASPGTWYAAQTVTISRSATPDAAVAARVGVAPADLFNLTVSVVQDGRRVDLEIFQNLTVVPASTRFIRDVLDAESQLLRVKDPVPAAPPANARDVAVAAAGTDGVALDDASYIGAGLETAHEGLFALDKADLFNLLCIPPPTLDQDTSATVWTQAVAYCRSRRAMLIVDPPAAMRVDNAATLLGPAGTDARNAALYFPRVKQPDITAEGRIKTFVPCGVVAGVMARTDAARGVWKAPAGIDAALAGVADLERNLTDDENGQLNPIGINCLRAFPIIGRVIWGARTMRGADILADEYKYVPVRRLALFIEESLFRGTQWVVFEPNDEPLWAHRAASTTRCCTGSRPADQVTGRARPTSPPWWDGGIAPPPDAGKYGIGLQVHRCLPGRTRWTDSRGSWRRTRPSARCPSRSSNASPRRHASWTIRPAWRSWTRSPRPGTTCSWSCRDRSSCGRASEGPTTRPTRSSARAASSASPRC